MSVFVCSLKLLIAAKRMEVSILEPFYYICKNTVIKDELLTVVVPLAIWVVSHSCHYAFFKDDLEGVDFTSLQSLIL